ncbi:MAG: chemotaxis protein CheW [Anaerolineae bacterium]|nr:chemotaxis protein CheW [Anaerolineae bacterium]
MEFEEADNQRAKQILQQRARSLARTFQQETLDDKMEVAVLALGQERYALETKFISEVITLDKLTPLPGLPAFWIGLINLRRRLVPLLDLSCFLGLKPFPLGEITSEKETDSGQPQGKSGHIVLINEGGNLIGLLVDRVIDVQHISCAEISPSPVKKNIKEHTLTEGITRGLFTIIDLEKLFSDPRLVIDEKII